MVTMLITSILLVVSTVGAATWRERGLPESISAMANLLLGEWRWLWSVWMIAVAVCTFIPVIDILDARGLGIFGFLPMALLVFVAAMPVFVKEQKRTHDVLGIAVGVLSQIPVVLICADWLFAWSLFVFLMGSVYIQPGGWLGKAMKGKGVLVSEMVCHIALIGSALTAYCF